MLGPYYFSQLSSLEQRRFKHNLLSLTSMSLKWFLNHEFDDFKTFVCSAFVFSSSMEGLFYWNDISNKIVREGLIVKRYIKKVDLC